MFRKLHGRALKAGRGKKKEKSSELLGNDIKKHFEMPVSISIHGVRHSQGHRTWPGPCGGTVK